jgi:hypothetical protein
MRSENRFSNRQPHAASLDALALIAAAKELVENEWLFRRFNTHSVIGNMYQ